MDTWINIGLFVTYILLTVAFVSLIGFPVLYTIQNFQNAKKGLLAILGICVILFLIYIVSPADQGVFYENAKVGAKESKMIGAGLITTYLLGAGAIIYLLYIEVRNWFN
jgi:steroid 5-alpha reductase family enzyme